MPHTSKSQFEIFWLYILKWLLLIYLIGQSLNQLFTNHQDIRNYGYFLSVLVLIYLYFNHLAYFKSQFNWMQFNIHIMVVVTIINSICMLLINQATINQINENISIILFLFNFYLSVRKHQY